jgi:uncharacterized membrane protein (DUF4010 family)
MWQYSDIITRGSLALALGLIIGFQRERKESTVAGIRTFPLFALIGFFCGLLDKGGASWVLAAGLLSISAILFRTANSTSGITTEMAGLLVYLLGAYFAVGEHIELAVVTGGVCALLLHLKETMHAWVSHLRSGEVGGIMQFILISFVILPLLPDKTFDVFGVFNPKQVWMMVVLITGLSLTSYSVQKVLGPRIGLMWAGVFGGLISSTATTVTLARLSSRMGGGRSFVAAVIVSSTIAFVRIMLEVFLVAPKVFLEILTPLSILFGVMILQTSFAYIQAKYESIEASEVDVQNPSQIKAAGVFGILYGLILYLSTWAKSEFGNSGLFIISVFSGLIDIDAITISTSKLLQIEAIETDMGWKSILLAFMSNLAFKGGMILVFAHSALKLKLGFHFLFSLFTGLIIFIFWN